MSAATVDKIQDKLNKLNIKKCETIIIHVGGNDADKGEISSLSEKTIKSY